MHPTPLLILLAALPAVASLTLVVMPAWLPVVLGLDAAVLVTALIDLLVGLPRRAQFTVTVGLPATWSQGRAETVIVTIGQQARWSRQLRLVLDLPNVLEAMDPPAVLRLAGRGRALLERRIMPRERGRGEAHGVHLAVDSRLGLWRRHLRVGDVIPVAVYPDLKQLADYALMARTNRLALIGVRTVRRLGGDTEFERLKDWQPGDPLTRIDWKATARRDHLTVRAYQISQSQTLMLMLDAGRLMAARTPGAAGGTVSLLDQAIKACLLAAHVAINHGDQVGLLVYDSQVRRFLKPEGGAQQVHRIVHALHDIHPRLEESRHDLACLHLARRLRKRCLVVHLTQVMDDLGAATLHRHAVNLASRHLPLTVLLRDHDLYDCLAGNGVDYWTNGAAALIHQWRRTAIDRLTAAGALTLDLPAEQLASGVVNEYLRVKARHLL